MGKKNKSNNMNELDNLEDNMESDIEEKEELDTDTKENSNSCKQNGCKKNCK